jgi:hypothetical protein
MNVPLALAALLVILAAGLPLNALLAQDLLPKPPSDPSTRKAPEEDQTSPSPPPEGAPLNYPAAQADPSYPPVTVPDVSETLSQKFMSYAVSTVGPRALFNPIFRVSIRMLNPKDGFPRDWQRGAGAIERNYANALARNASLQTGRFLTGALLHEDFRYRPSISRNPLLRALHAVSFTFVDKSDSGKNQIAFANFAGAASGGFVGALYLPSGFNNLSHAETRSAIAFGGFIGQNLFREFAPDLLRAAHKLHLPVPRLSTPEWWVNRK